MKNPALKVLLMAAVLIPVSVYAQPRPGNPTTATVITKAEIDKISATEQSQRVRDENAKVVDIGDGWSMELVALITTSCLRYDGTDLVAAVFEFDIGCVCRGKSRPCARFSIQDGELVLQRLEQAWCCEK